MCFTFTCLINVVVLDNPHPLEDAPPFQISYEYTLQFVFPKDEWTKSFRVKINPLFTEGSIYNHI